MPQNNGNGKEKAKENENGNNGNGNGKEKGKENDGIVPITKINTTNQNKKGEIKNKNMLIATEEGQLPYMCIIS